MKARKFVQLRSAPVMDRREFIKASGSAAALLMAHRSWGAEPSNAKLNNDDILAQCSERIQKHRQGDGIITVRDTNRKGIPSVRVKIEQLRHEFRFGCNFF